MKVLCIYNHPEYCRPLVRSAGAFVEFGIDFEIRRVISEHEAREAGTEPHDVLLMQEPPVFDLLKGAQVILLERVDGAQLRASRDYINQVAGVIKSYVFRNRADYNTTNDRYHIQLLHEAGAECRRPLFRDTLPDPQLSSDALAILRVGYSGFAGHDIIGQALTTPIDFDAPRPVDVHFVGTLNYEGTEVHLHRAAAFRVASDWHGRSIAVPGRTVARREYYHQITQSKAVLCPWGWGESTYRDYEAMALGAVVVKPNSDHVKAWPDIYRAGQTYVACLPDFSDAAEKITGVVENWDDYQPMRETARKLVADAWQPRAIAERMAEQIRGLVC